MPMSPRLLRPRSAFSPRSVAGLSLWLDGLDNAVFTLNGSAVSEWRDKSGNNNHMAQATALNQPARAGNYVEFDGSSDFLTSSITQAGNTVALCVFANTRASLATGNIIDNLYSFNNFPSSPNNQGVAQSTSNTFQTRDTRRLVVETPNGGTRQQSINGAALSAAAADISGQTLYLATGVWAGTTADAARTFQLGVLVSGASSFYGANRIYELVLYRQSVSTAGLARLQRYLAARWGITLS